MKRFLSEREWLISRWDTMSNIFFPSLNQERKIKGQKFYYSTHGCFLIFIYSVLIPSEWDYKIRPFFLFSYVTQLNPTILSPQSSLFGPFSGVFQLLSFTAGLLNRQMTTQTFVEDSLLMELPYPHPSGTDPSLSRSSLLRWRPFFSSSQSGA